MMDNKPLFLGKISLIAVFLILLGVYYLRAGKREHDGVDSSEEKYDVQASEKKPQTKVNAQRAGSPNINHIQPAEYETFSEETPAGDANPRSRTQPDAARVLQDKTPITILPADSVSFLDSHVLDMASDASFAKYPSIDQLPAVAEQIVGKYEGTIQWKNSRSVGTATLEIEGSINKERRFEGSFTFRIVDEDGLVMAERNSIGLLGDRIHIEASPVLTVFIEPESKSNNQKIQLFFPDGPASQQVQGSYYFNFNREGEPLSHAAYINLVKRHAEH
ncbi:MAG TPA: hypothetical protein VE954_38970 [Oligoflexus sp.]|uniref:hypothetical protein n=1 Tax=Oligoflexus sp. TaxID=1971216 RepID=UPI002D2B088B|nr:hypothetical protein [Oligoflexus sp.]HYX39124.1 hypothetical protein [Oligoflexus sp.]